jgi:hypothetical protein
MLQMDMANNDNRTVLITMQNINHDARWWLVEISSSDSISNTSSLANINAGLSGANYHMPNTKWLQVQVTADAWVEMM